LIVRELGFFVIWVFLISSFDLLNSVEIFDDEIHHLRSGISDGLHGQGGESVWEHSSNHKSTELDGLEDINACGSNSGVEGAEKGKTDKASRSDSESLSNSGGSVSCGIKSISLGSDSSWESGHLGNTTGVVRDWSISVNGKGNWEGSEHSEGGETDSVHTRVGESVSDGGGKANDWDDAGVVSESESEDDVWGWSLGA